MGDCLVTKLKAAVNNPDLPVFEKMQQFTLDAITASGNSSMTDEQKWALNHFFYQIGAIDQDELWDKINILMIPMLATPVSGYNAYMVYDYKQNLTQISNNAKLTGANGGLEATSKTVPVLAGTTPFVNSDAAAVIFMETAGHSISQTRSLCPMYVYDDNSDFSLGTTLGSTNYQKLSATSGKSAVGQFSSSLGSLIMYGVNVKNGPWGDGSLEAMICTTSKQIYKGQDFAYNTAAFIDHTGHSVSSMTLTINPGPVLGLIMSFADTLTDAEMDKICAAALELRDAFTTE